MKDFFNNEVVLITGAASGIGKACVETFLDRGSYVAGIDINPLIIGMYKRNKFLGIECDLGSEKEILKAINKTVKIFGSLDILVLNAGIFPRSCRIESLQIEDWKRVMQINLDANLILMREAYPYLKTAKKGGRVVVNGSRNVSAPGPGAAAYSTSKAALTQLARVAALEWGEDGIRVNIIHAHAVFDTGIWTDEVLQKRAAQYNMTVEEYKTNNILKVELKSIDVAKLVVELCGPLFSKTTGAQIPIDGGNNRVI